MSDKNKGLYFVALLPPEPILSQVMAMKQEIANNYGSKAALRSPAHVTLHMPFKFREDREQELTEFFVDFVKDETPFCVNQNGCGCFEPKVVFVNVEQSEDLANLKANLVRNMRRTFNLYNADYKDKPFHPHMTIAFRDLKKPAFYEAWSTYEKKPINLEWSCKSIFLLKHTGKIWQAHQEFQFGAVKNE